MPPKPGTCLICGKIFSQSQHVKAHMLTHTNERPFKCNICESAHRTKSNLKHHILYVHDPEKRRLEKKVQCIMCENAMRKSHLNSHLLSHIKEKPHHLCSICDQEFVQSFALNSHVKSHEKLKGDPCVFCEKTFSIRSNPNEHIRSHIKERPYFCKRCPSSFSHQGSLRAHIRAVHLKERHHSCEICSKTFYSSNSRDVHMSVHLNEKPFQCTLCFKRFKSSWGLKRHLDKHNNLQFPCEKCSKTYSSKSSLSSHEKTKHQPNQCIFCEKNITTNFMTHLLKHTNERHFPCNCCKKDFQCKAHLQSHVIHIHSTERPYPCEVCGKLFKTKVNRHSHIKSHLNGRSERIQGSHESSIIV